jgi:hypothetical protein
MGGGILRDGERIDPEIVLSRATRIANASRSKPVSWSDRSSSERRKRDLLFFGDLLHRRENLRPY